MKHTEDRLMLHRRFIPYDEKNAMQHDGMLRVFVDVTYRVFAKTLDRDRKHGVCHSSSWKEEGRNAQRCDTEHNMSLSTKAMGQSAINKCLPCSSRAVEEKCLA
jgi:hypothetical protein